MATFSRRTPSHVVRNALLAAGVGAAAGLVLRGRARQARRMEFGGRVVLITGGSRGLGLSIARQFASEGARVALLARDAQELDRAAADLRGTGADVYTVVADVTDRAAVESAVQQTVREFGTIDVLVNNAGTISVGPMETMGIADYEVAMKTHFWGPLNTTLAVLPFMKDRARSPGAAGSPGPRIVNISSIGGKIAVPHLLPYSASKFALVGFSEGLRAELAKEQIYVTTVCPGLMRTGSPRNASFKGNHEAEYAWFKLSDSLPGPSMNVDRAAAQVVEACRFGDAEVVLSLPAKLAVAFHGVFNGLTQDLMGVANRMLPDAANVGGGAKLGRESETPLTRSFLTGLTQRAARRNNQM